MNKKIQEIKMIDRELVKGMRAGKYEELVETIKRAERKRIIKKIENIDPRIASSWSKDVAYTNTVNDVYAQAIKDVLDKIR